MSAGIIVTDALSLTQPWASLVDIGAKLVETRSWSTRYRGWLAIHAAKGMPRDCLELCSDHPYRDALSAHATRIVDAAGRHQLPRGEVICIARLVECKSTNHWTPSVDGREYQFGNYGPDRFGWIFDRVISIKPFTCKGSLGIWKLPTPIDNSYFKHETME